MTETVQSRVSIFDKSFSTPGNYCLITKSGKSFLYARRSELWKDKMNCYFVTLFGADTTPVSLEIHVYTLKEIDLRYNDISACYEV